MFSFVGTRLMYMEQPISKASVLLQGGHARGNGMAWLSPDAVYNGCMVKGLGAAWESVVARAEHSQCYCELTFSDTVFCNRVVRMDDHPPSAKGFLEGREAC